MALAAATEDPIEVVGELYIFSGRGQVLEEVQVTDENRIYKASVNTDVGFSYYLSSKSSQISTAKRQLTL